MVDFSIAERQAFAAILELAIREDLGKAGDITSAAAIPANAAGKAAFVSRQYGTLAGLPALVRTIARYDPALRLEVLLEDGQRIEPGYWIAKLEGPLRSILAIERTALNFLQHLSGVASLTRRYVDAVAGTRARILDTRKTLPGWRLLEKYAVRAGGGDNHRLGLFDAVLIKDNHLAAVDHDVEAAIHQCRSANPDIPIEVEVESLDQLEKALAAADVVLLDNMNLDQLRAAVARRDARSPSTLLEASGGVNLDTVRSIAETGVDRISVGAITHSAPALDIALDFV